MAQKTPTRYRGSTAGTFVTPARLDANSYAGRDARSQGSAMVGQQ